MVRIHPPESLRLPGEGSSAQGKSGPKVNPKGVADGKPVNIPVPPVYKYSERGRRRVGSGWKWHRLQAVSSKKAVGKSAAGGRAVKGRSQDQLD